MTKDDKPERWVDQPHATPELVPEWFRYLSKVEPARPHDYRVHKSLSEADSYLWLGVSELIMEWDAHADPTAQTVYDSVISVLGKQKKGHASKARTIAQMMERHALMPIYYGSLNEAYRNAKRLESMPATTF